MKIIIKKIKVFIRYIYYGIESREICSLVEDELFISGKNKLLVCENNINMKSNDNIKISIEYDQIIFDTIYKQ